MKTKLLLTLLALVSWVGVWADGFSPNAQKGYKLKLKGYDLYVNFAISGYTETNAVNATKLTSEANASVFAISSVADTENGFSLKWRNEYLKNAGSYFWNSNHGTTADTWYIVPVEIDGETYYNIKKNTNASGDIFFGTNQTVGEGTYLYTNVNGGNIKWEIVECTYDAMMVNQGYWPETSTDASPKYYGIKNLRASKFAQFATNNSMMALVNQNNFDASCYFYFIDVEEDGLPYDVKAVKIKNAAAPGLLCANANSYNTTGATWYLKKGVYTSNTESIAIGKSSTDWTSNGWNNYQGTGNYISTWSSNDQGSAWEIAELNDQPHAIAPTLSTADNKVLYSILNFRQNKYADSQEEGGQIKEVAAKSVGSFWYFEDASAENTAELNEGVLPVYMVNALNGKYLKSHSTGSNSGEAKYGDSKADAQIWYLSPHHKANGDYHYYGYGIGKTTQIAGGANGQVAWNDHAGNYVCQYGVDDAGSIWKFVTATDADVNTAITNAKTAWNKEVALYTFADYYSYDKKNVTTFGTAVDAVSTSGNNVSNLQSAYPALTARAAMLAGGKIGTPTAGDVIRLKNFSNSKYMNQADEATTLSVVDAESDNNLWILGGDAENGFSLQNKASEKYLKGAGQSTDFSLSDDPVMFDITNIENCFAVLRQHDMTGNYEYAHYGAGTNTIVGWETSADATRWSIACVDNTETATLLATANEIIAKTGVGYPTAESTERSMLQSAIEDGSAPLLRDAIPAYKTSSNIQMPEDGKVYVFTNVATDGSKHYIYENSTQSQLQWQERGENDINTLPANGKYICRKNGTYYTFVNTETGHYLIWKGSNGGYNSNKGYEDAYNDTDCKLFVERAQYTTSNMGNASSQEDLFGWICFGGIRSGYTGIDKCFLYTVNSGFNQDGNHTQRYGSNHSSMFIVEEATYPYNTATLRDGGDGANYASIYLPFAMTVPAGVKAYAAVEGTDSEENPVLNLTKVGEDGEDIPAGAYILYSETVSGNVTFLPAASNPTSDATNSLTGSTLSTATLPTGTNYVLSGKNGIGFYKYTGSDYPLGKAIYNDATNEAREFHFSFGEDVETAIRAIESENSGLEIYNLAGQKVSKAEKGIFIVNGKKVAYK